MFQKGTKVEANRLCDSINHWLKSGVKYNNAISHDSYLSICYYKHCQIISASSESPAFN